MGTFGKRGEKKKPFKYTEEYMQDRLYFCHFLSTSSIKYDINGLYVFGWESDKIFETKSGYIYEFEIKVSKADFKNDFTKVKKHQVLNETYVNKDAVTEKAPNYFYYVTPPDLVSSEELPDYAGLIYIDERGWFCQVMKPAPLLHKRKYTDEELNLTEKFYYNMNSWREKGRKAKENEKKVKEMLKEELSSRGQDLTYKELKVQLDEMKRQKEDLSAKNKRLMYDMRYNGQLIRKLIGLLNDNNIKYDYQQLCKEVEEMVFKWK